MMTACCVRVRAVAMLAGLACRDAASGMHALCECVEGRPTAKPATRLDRGPLRRRAPCMQYMSYTSAGTGAPLPVLSVWL